jgi:alpha-D-xyloside xylohydrolase
VPLGEPIDSTAQTQKIAKVKVYPGASADFTLYDDDGTSYAYEHGVSKITHLHWDEQTQRLMQEGPPAWEGSNSDVVEIVGPQ